MECKICQSPEPGTHFKQACCRACAAFFRRTIQLKLRYRCKRSWNCKLNKDNRFFCRFCRMKRCISAGMVSNENPDIPMDFYLDSSDLDPKCSDDDRLPSFEENELFTEENIFHNYPEFIIEFKEKLRDILSSTNDSGSRFPFGLSMYQHATVAYAEHNAKWPNCTREKLIFDDILDMNAIFIDTFKEFQYVTEFCMAIPQFARLPFDQKAKMVRRFLSPFIFFDRMFVTVELLGNDVRDTRSVNWNGHAADARITTLDTSKITDKTDERVKQIINSAEDFFVSVLIEFKRLNPDHYELIYMFLSSLWNVFGKEGMSEETIRIAEEIQERLSEELFLYYKYEKRVQNYSVPSIE